MRAANGVCLAIGIVGIALGITALVRSDEVPSGFVGWPRACHGAPHERLGPPVLQGLREAGLQPGLNGWQPTAAWVNEQCVIFGLS